MVKALNNKDALDYLHPSPSAEAKAVLRDLIAFNTTTSPHLDYAQDTTQATDYVATYLREQTGADVQLSEPFEYPPQSGKMHKTLLASWLPKTPSYKKPLAFSGHIDVVPAPGTWQGNDPFTAREEGGKIIGRGALDLKGQVASLMATFQQLHRQGKWQHLDRPVTFMLSSCEEVGLRGAADVCELAKKHKLEPGEIVVIEPTDGYIGLGAKGVRQEELSFTRKQPEPEMPEVWPHYCNVTIASHGGHSSLQGASPADPALASVAVFKLVQQLRKDGIPAEICHVDYGVAGNVVGGNATVTIGYAPAKEHGDAREPAAIAEFLRHQLSVQQLNANLFLKTVTFAANATNKLKREVTGMDFGKVAIDVEAISHENNPDYPVTLTHTPHGWHSDSAAEHALDVVERIYDLHAAQKRQGQPKDYAMPLLGFTKLSVPLLHGDSNTASLSYDIRYPAEAQRENGNNVESMAAIADKIHRTAEANPAFTVTKKGHISVAPYVVPPEDTRLPAYVDIAKKTGFTKYRSAMTNLPYGSDGNVISKQFPDALVVTMANGGFSNLPHGEGEHLTEQQIRKNIDLFSGIITQRAILGGEGNIKAR